jgi:hypothetical protein
VKQWADVHGLSHNPANQTLVNGFPRSVWCDEAGQEVLEYYAITGMAHGTPLATGHAEGQSGVAGAFLLDVGISSSFHVAKFWGIAGPERPRAKTLYVGTAPELRDFALRGANEEASTSERSPSSPMSIDIGGVIARALRAAGLMKRSSCLDWHGDASSRKCSSNDM